MATVAVVHERELKAIGGQRKQMVDELLGVATQAGVLVYGRTYVHDGAQPVCRGHEWCITYLAVCHGN